MAHRSAPRYETQRYSPYPPQPQYEQSAYSTTSQPQPSQLAYEQPLTYAPPATPSHSPYAQASPYAPAPAQPTQPSQPTYTYAGQPPQYVQYQQAPPGYTIQQTLVPISKANGHGTPHVARKNSNGEKVFPAGPVEEGVLKIKSSSDVKSVAGKIAHSTREGEAPQLVARGSSAVNTAIKAIGIARQYLRDQKLDLTVSVYHRFDGDNETGRSVMFTLAKIIGVQSSLVASALKCSKTSNPVSVAGSIANKVRQGERVSVEGVGPIPVDCAVNAVVLARRYLSKDGFDLSFRPEFVTLDFNGKKATAVRLNILSAQK